MNTPRSKAPKRYTGPDFSALRPDGTYADGLWSERHTLLVGQIATFWVLVEDQMIEFLRDLMGGDPTLAARQIFRSIASNEARRRLMQTLLERTALNRSKGAEYDQILADFYSLNGRRNTYVHGFWITYDDNKTAYLSAESIEDFQFLNAREVKITELEKTFNDMDALSRKLRRYWKSDVQARLASLQRKLPQPPGKGSNATRPRKRKKAQSPRPRPRSSPE